VKLDELGCFKNIGVYIDTSKGPNATSDGLEARLLYRKWLKRTLVDRMLVGYL